MNGRLLSGSTEVRQSVRSWSLQRRTGAATYDQLKTFSINVRENVHPNAETAQLNGKLDYRLEGVEVARIVSNPGACSMRVCEGLDPLADAIDHDLLPVLVVNGVHQLVKRLRRTRPAAPEDDRGSSRGMG